MSAQNIVEELTDQSSANQYLTFRIGNEDYGIKILSVQEIRGWETVARVPNTPAYIKGVLNLRGTAVPVIDLRLRMDIIEPKYDITTVLIVVRAEIEGNERIASIVVDEVSDVMNADSNEIKKTPDFGDGVNTEFINGLVDVGGKMLMLFDVDNFMKHSDIYEESGEQI
ncbi:MAG: purine-binding chemotaxis protein CheW [Thiotrichaceae bacterium]|nr:purine-binding chemotaxis protein CheW [Thiotrichaceae bacterium]